jgi:hypothetical protein
VPDKHGHERELTRNAAQIPTSEAAPGADAHDARPARRATLATRNVKRFSGLSIRVIDPWAREKQD